MPATGPAAHSTRHGWHANRRPARGRAEAATTQFHPEQDLVQGCAGCRRASLLTPPLLLPPPQPATTAACRRWARGRCRCSCATTTRGNSCTTRCWRRAPRRRTSSPVGSWHGCRRTDRGRVAAQRSACSGIAPAAGPAAQACRARPGAPAPTRPTAPLPPRSRGHARGGQLHRRLQQLHLCLRADWLGQDAHRAGPAGQQRAGARPGREAAPLPALHRAAAWRLQAGMQPGPGST